MRKKIFQIFMISVFLVSACSSGAEDAPEGKAPFHGKIPVKIIKKIPMPKGYREGLLVKGRDIWINNGEKGNTLVLDMDSGKIVSEIKPVGTFTEGITEFGENRYWTTDWDAKEAYLVRIDGGTMVKERSVSFKPARPTGITWDGSHLYVITWTRGLGTKYHILKINEKGKIVGRSRIRNISEPSQIAWDGKDFWISSWYSGRVYRVNRDTLGIEGYFQPPIKDTTGLAWDGEYLWVTGTDSDLYQVRVLER